MAHTAESKSQDSLPITNVTFLFSRSFNVLRSDFRYSSIIARFYHVFSRDSSMQLISFSGWFPIVQIYTTKLTFILSVMLSGTIARRTVTIVSYYWYMHVKEVNYVCFESICFAHKYDTYQQYSQNIFLFLEYLLFLSLCCYLSFGNRLRHFWILGFFWGKWF